MFNMVGVPALFQERRRLAEEYRQLKKENCQNVVHQASPVAPQSQRPERRNDVEQQNTRGQLECENAGDVVGVYPNDPRGYHIVDAHDFLVGFSEDA